MNEPSAPSTATPSAPFPWVSWAVLAFLAVALASQVSAVVKPESYVPGARQARKNAIVGIAQMSDAQAAAKIRQDAVVQIVVLGGLGGLVIGWLRLRRRLSAMPSPLGHQASHGQAEARPEA